MDILRGQFLESQSANTLLQSKYQIDLHNERERFDLEQKRYASDRESFASVESQLKQDIELLKQQSSDRVAQLEETLQNITTQHTTLQTSFTLEQQKWQTVFYTRTRTG